MDDDRQPGNVIETDKFYFRGDDAIIREIIEGDRERCFMYLGLRRFGKTSFLQRIHRWIEEDRRYPHHKAVMLELQRGVDAATGDSIIALLDACPREGKSLILLVDELQSLGKQPGEKSNPFIGALVRALDAARGGDLDIKLVFAEPTNVFDWFADCGDRSKIANESHRLAAYFQESAANLIDILSADESCRLLTDNGSLKIDDEVLDNLYTAYGGNPWFLDQARAIVHSTPKFCHADESDNLIDAVDESLQHRGLGGIKSILNALSKSEQVVLKVMDAEERSPNDSGLNFRADRFWTRAGRKVAKRLMKLGVIAQGANDIPRQINSKILREQIEVEYGQNSIIQNPTWQELVLWKQMIGVPHPKQHNSRGNAVVHQFADLHFDENENPNWERYLAWLKARKEADEKKAGIDEREDRPDQPKRPHLIIVCGNIIADTNNLTGDAADYERGYDNAVRRGLKTLSRALEHIEPADNATEASSSQIVVVPGVLDLKWKGKAGDDVIRTYNAIWNKAIRDFDFSGPGAVRDFPSLNLNVLPLDSANPRAVGMLSDKAVKEVVLIRQRIKEKFKDDWLTASHTKKDKEREESLERLANSTLRYIVEVDTASAADKKLVDAVHTHTFEWAGLGQQTLVSEAGFVSESECLNLLTDNNEKRNLDNSPRFPIAVVHHYPQNLKRSLLIEFFDPSTFRRKMASYGVPMVLHGHSARQQTVSWSFNDAIRDGQPRPLHPLRLLGCGSFSRFGNLTWDPDSPDSGLRQGAGTFNEIRVTRHDPAVQHRHAYRVEIRYCQMTGNGPVAVDSDTFTFGERE